MVTDLIGLQTLSVAARVYLIYAGLRSGMTTSCVGRSKSIIVAAHQLIGMAGDRRRIVPLDLTGARVVNSATS